MRRRRLERKATAAGTIAPGDGDGDGPPEKRPGGLAGAEEGAGGAEEEDPDEAKKKKFPDPLVRSNTFFGGVINDWKRRFPGYLSDIKDGLNTQVLAATIFIYFACLSGAIAFGGITAENTGSRIGKFIVVKSIN